MVVIGLGSAAISYHYDEANANNGLFSYYKFDAAAYSPRAALQKRSNQRSNEYSAFKDLSDNRRMFPRDVIQQDVNERLAGLTEAVEHAAVDINNLMENYSETFIDNSKLTLDRYLQKIRENIIVYNSSIPLHSEG